MVTLIHCVVASGSRTGDQLCFAPVISNITVSSAPLSDGNMTVTLHWNVTTRPAQNTDDYCNQSSWRIGVGSYTSPDAVPPDFKALNFAKAKFFYGSTAVAEYTFPHLFNNSTYYKFYVGYKPRPLYHHFNNELKSATSYVYYFGVQGKTLILYNVGLS